MNIVLVVFDSLRRDAIGAYGRPPWGRVHTPELNAFAGQSLVMTRAYPESLPTLPTRRALYTGQRVYPYREGDVHHKGDFVGAPGWGPILAERDTLAEMLSAAGYRTALISDVYHMFKPSKNFARGFDQWMFLRGQETDPCRSGPIPSPEELKSWLPPKGKGKRRPEVEAFLRSCLANIADRRLEEEYFPARVFRESANWLQENARAEKFFLTVECFDPHEPWLVPSHYRKMYLKEDGPENVCSSYRDTSDPSAYVLSRTRANYSGAVTQCDRWFGYFMRQMEVMGLLDDTLVIVTTDHGHSMGEGDYMGKRGYPSRPAVYDVVLMVRFPRGKHGGKRSDMFVQHTDVAASILKAAGVSARVELDGRDFLAAAAAGRDGRRDHVTVGWGSTPTVITRRWWFNCKADGTGALLHDLRRRKPFETNVAGKYRGVARELFETALADAGGEFPAWLIDLAAREADAPGCSDLAARE